MTQTDRISLDRSEFSGRHTEGGITVIVEIFRRSGSNEWRMEVTSLGDQLTDWNDSFASAHEAWEEFIYVVNGRSRRFPVDAFTVRGDAAD